MTIRKALSSDQDTIWDIFREVVSHGDTYVFSPDITKEEALSYWMGESVNCYVLEEEGQILGTFIIKSNQPGLGSHVANASFMVHQDARGKGIGETMGRFAITEAKRLGYRSMQFNIVIATNKTALRLWEKLGFKIIGTSPEAFHHQNSSFVDAHILHRFL